MAFSLRAIRAMSSAAMRKVNDLKMAGLSFLKSFTHREFVLIIAAERMVFALLCYLELIQENNSELKRLTRKEDIYLLHLWTADYTSTITLIFSIYLIFGTLKQCKLKTGILFAWMLYAASSILSSCVALIYLDSIEIYDLYYLVQEVVGKGACMYIVNWYRQSLSDYTQMAMHA